MQLKHEQMQAPTNLVLPHTKGAAKSNDGEFGSEEEEPGGHPHALVGQVMLHAVQVQHHAQQAPAAQGTDVKEVLRFWCCKYLRALARLQVRTME